MAYTSDLRIKNLIREIDLGVREILSKKNLDKNLALRLFDESSEDKIPWEKGGLSFTDPKTKRIMGSNDAGWAIMGKPIVVVEGTFGTERGQFGDGQLNRASHSMGVALNNSIGVTLIPFKGESYIKKGVNKDIKSDKIKYQYAYLHKSMVLAGISVSKNNKGKFLFIDPYDKQVLIDLIVNAVLKYYKKDNDLENIIEKIIINMKNYVGNYVSGARSKQVITKLYDSSGRELSVNARFYTQNLAALTTSTKRDAHGLLGKNLVELHTSDKKIVSIFIRLDKNDIKILKKRNSKEMDYIFNNPGIIVRNFDDLIFKDANLKNKIMQLRKDNLHVDTQKELLSLLQKAFNEKCVLVKM